MKSKTSTKELITLALYELAYKKDFDSITISELCKKANVSRMSFYRFFSSKDDVFIAYCDERFDDFFSKVKSQPNLKYDELLLLFFIEVKDKSKQIKLLEKTEKLEMLSHLFESYAAYLIQKIIPIDKGTHYNKYTAPFLAGGMTNVVIRWCNRDFKDTPEEMVRNIEQIISL